MKTTHRIIVLALFSFPFLLPATSRATLGEGSDSVTRDRHTFSATAGATTTHARYTVQVITSEATTIREYLDASGTVFAVAWNGMAPPDLTTLLGPYAGEYREAKRLKPRSYGQKRSRVQANRVVVETWGHMRNLQGRAWVPSLLPEGVTVNEIK